MKIILQFEIEDYLSSMVIALCAAISDDEPIGTSPVHRFLPEAFDWIRSQIQCKGGLYEDDCAGWDDKDLEYMRWFAKGPEK